MAFLEWYCKMDGAGRITIPKAYRQWVRDGVILLPGTEETHIAGYPSRGEVSNEFCTSSVLATKLDNRGRITVSAGLRKIAAMKRYVVFTAEDKEYFELWDQKLWESEVAQALAEVEILKGGTNGLGQGNQAVVKLPGFGGH